MNPCPKPEPRPKKARKPLKRTWMKKRAPRRLDPIKPMDDYYADVPLAKNGRRRGSDPAYLDFVRSLPCAVSSVRCSGTIHAHHAIHRSQGGKDREAVPLCMVHHQDWHDHSGPFFTLSRMERFAWAMRAIAETQARYEESIAVRTQETKP